MGQGQLTPLIMNEDGYVVVPAHDSNFDLSTLGGAIAHPFQEHTSARYPLGSMLWDVGRDRVYRYFENGATALAVAVLVQSPVPASDFDDLNVDTAPSVGDSSVEVAEPGSTNLAADELEGGFLLVNDQTGQGEIYRIKSNDAATGGGGGAFTVNLEGEGETLQTALATGGSTQVTVIKNPFKDVIVHPSPPTAAVVGVTTAPTIAGDSFGWLQRRGLVSVLTEGTLVIAHGVRASETTDGAVTNVDRDEAGQDDPTVGHAVRANAASTDHAPVILTME